MSFHFASAKRPPKPHNHNSALPPSARARSTSLVWSTSIAATISLRQILRPHVSKKRPLFNQRPTAQTTPGQQIRFAKQLRCKTRRREHPPLPFPGNGAAPQSSSDLSQVTQPQLSTSGFATMNNCNCVSGPSSYTAASGIGCGQNYGYAAPVGYTAPQQQIAAPAQMPALTPMNQTMTGRPLPQSATGAPASSLFTLGQSNYAVQVGQGLWGQPVAYVPGQRVRNWIRYMSP